MLASSDHIYTIHNLPKELITEILINVKNAHNNYNHTAIREFMLTSKRYSTIVRRKSRDNISLKYLRISIAVNSTRKLKQYQRIAELCADQYHQYLPKFRRYNPKIIKVFAYYGMKDQIVAHLNQFRCPFHLAQDVIKSALYGNQLNLAKWAYENGFPTSGFSLFCRDIFHHGNIECAKWAINNDIIKIDHILRDAVIHNHMQLFDYISAHYTLEKNHIKIAMSAALHHGRIKFIDKLQHYDVFTSNKMSILARFNKRSIQWIFDHPVHLNKFIYMNENYELLIFTIKLALAYNIMPLSELPRMLITHKCIENVLLLRDSAFAHLFDFAPLISPKLRHNLFKK